MTFEEGQQIDDEIRNLNLNQKSLTYILGKQTLIVRADLEKFHPQNEENEKRLMTYQETLGKLTEEIKQMENVNARLNYSTRITRMSHILEIGIENYVQSENQLLASIQDAREGRLYPMRLTTKKLESILRDIQNHALCLKFHLPRSSVRLYDLMQISTTTIKFN